MSTSALQGVVLLLGLFQFALACIVLYLDPRRPVNIVLSIYLAVFALFSAGVAGMTSATTVLQATPWTWLVALAGPQVGIGLTYLTLHIYRPDWLKRVYIFIPLAVLSTTPVILTLIDAAFGTHLIYGGLDPRSYTGGYTEPATLLTAPLGGFFRLTNLIVLQFVEVGLLLYLLRQPDLRPRRASLWILLALEGLGATSQIVLRPVVGATTAFALIQFALTTGVLLAVTQAGALSTRRQNRLAQLANPRRRPVSVRAKLLGVVVAIIVIIVGAQAWISLDNIAQQNQQNERRRLIQLYEDYRAVITDHEAAAAALSTSLADRADIKALFKAGDRAGLLRLLSPMFNTLKSRYNIVHLYLENPDGTVFVRIHQPALYGDDITYRSTAVQALTLRETVAGVDIGPNRVGVRSVSPLFDDDQFIGLIEVGLDYDQAFLNALHNRTGTDYRLWLSYEAVATAGLAPAADAPAAPLGSLFYYAGTGTAAPNASADVVQRVLSTNRLEMESLSANGQRWTILVAPLQAYPDRTIGTIEVVASQTVLLTDFLRSQTTVMALAGGLALLAFALTWVTTNATVLTPLRHLTEIARRQLAGDLKVRAQIDTNDEFSQLGNTLNALTGQLGDSIGLLEQRVSARTQQLRTSADVGRAAASILDTDELLHTIANLITERFGYYYAAVFTLDSTRYWAELREATGEAGRILKEQRHRLEINGQSMVGTAIKTRRPRIALDTGAEAIRFANPLLPATRSEIALPFVIGDRVLGALDVQSTEADAFDESSAAVLQSMADQIAIALSNAEQFHQTELTLQNTRNLYAASQEISTATTTAGILRALITHIVPDASRSGIMLTGPLDEYGKPAYFEFVATWIQPDQVALTQLVRPGTRFTPQQLPVISDVTAARPVIVPDANADDVPPALRTLIHRFSSEAMIALALTVDQTFLGILVVGYQQPRIFSPDYVQTLVTLSNQAAIVIQNRRSLAETQATLAQLDLINRRLTGDAWRTYTAPLGGTLKAQDTAPGVVADQPTATALDAPIVVRGEPIGALKLQDIDPDRVWTSADRALLEAVASEIAVSIDNARLLEQTERRAQREQFIAEVSRKMLAASDMRSVIQIAGDELSRALSVARTEVTVGLAEFEPDHQPQPQSETSARS